MHAVKWDAGRPKGYQKNLGKRWSPSRSRIRNCSPSCSPGSSALRIGGGHSGSITQGLALGCRAWAAGLQSGLGPPCSAGAAGGAGAEPLSGRSLAASAVPPALPVSRPLPRGVPLPGAGPGRGPGAERLRRAGAGGVSEAAAGGGRQQQLRRSSGIGTGSRHSLAGPR